MSQPESTSYDGMAESYHLIFENWNTAIERQGKVLSQLLPASGSVGTVLDCACGIGTQALGLAKLGYMIEGTDLSVAEIRRAQREAAARGLKIAFRVDDMRLLRTSAAEAFGAVIAFDNALPHLDSDEEVSQALGTMHSRLRVGGTLLISLRDYGPLMEQRPTTTPAALFLDAGRRRIVHQVWDWQDDRRYAAHIYITQQMKDEWVTNHFITHYRAITLAEVATSSEKVGFREVRVLQPAESGYYQPIVAALRV